ncbi:MAG: DinB family protein [Bacteroidia bacterium]|nr:DinB family protein [Bacteroidia bacterium]
METAFTQPLWQNFGAAIDMLRNAVSACPADYWQEKPGKFFYLSYHTTLFLDYYLSIPVTTFAPRLPYTLGDMDHLPPGAVDDVLPDQWYSQAEVLSYLAQIRSKGKTLIASATPASLQAPWITPEEVGLHGLCPTLVESYTVLEIGLYNLRHVQHHTAQLNLLLRQAGAPVPEWVAMAEAF